MVFEPLPPPRHRQEIILNEKLIASCDSITFNCLFIVQLRLIGYLLSKKVSETTAFSSRVKIRICFLMGRRDDWEPVAAATFFFNRNLWLCTMPGHSDVNSERFVLVNEF